MTRPETEQPRRAHRSPIRVGGVVGGILLIAVVLVGCGDDDSGDTAGSDPTAVLADYEDARNAGDIDALMSLYAADAVVTAHPRDSHSVDDPGDEPVANGIDEIRVLEFDLPTFQRPEDATEFFNVQVSGNRVTFDQRFFNDDGDCFGDSGNEVTLQDDKITHYDWGSGDDSLCE